MSQRHSVEMMELPPRVITGTNSMVVLDSLKRKPAPQPGDSGYGILTSLSFVFFKNYVINYYFIPYLHAFSYKP